MRDSTRRAAILIMLVAAAPRVATAGAQAAGPGLTLDIDGNLVLVDEVYMAALDLPDGAVATPATALLVERQILTFLRRAGYALATVDARAVGKRIEVRMDEGRLARIVVRGRDAFSTVAFQLQIDLPYDVFNRPQLERLLRRFGSGRRVTYRLAPTRQVEHTGPQVNPLALMPGSAPLPPGAYELHIEFAGADRGSAVALVAGIDPDSIRAGATYGGRSGLIDGDRWELGAQVGANFFFDLRRQADELHFSRVLTEARWMAPNMGGLPLRPTVRIREDLLRRQRQDLLVESYWWNRLEGAAGLTVEPWTGIVLTAEFGAQKRDLFDVSQIDGMEEVEEEVEEVGPSSDLRFFTGLSGRLDFEPERLRVDRRQRMIFEVRRFLGLDRRPLWLLDGDYRRVFELGWNDIWIRAAAGGTFGTYEIADAIPMTGRYLRGVYGHQLYLDRVAAIALEYRLSLTRDMFKLGLFHEAAAFREESGRMPGPEFRAGNSFGPSFHALVLDALQLDIYYAAGFLFDEGTFDHGVSLRVEKAF